MEIESKDYKIFMTKVISRESSDALSIKREIIIWGFFCVSTSQLARNHYVYRTVPGFVRGKFDEYRGIDLVLHLRQRNIA